MSKLSIIEEVGVISGADEPKENPFEICKKCENNTHEECVYCESKSHYAVCDKHEESEEVKTCFWCDRKPVKGRTSCAYHISPSGKNDEALGRLDYHVNINPLG